MIKVCWNFIKKVWNKFVQSPFVSFVLYPFFKGKDNSEHPWVSWIFLFFVFFFSIVGLAEMFTVWLPYSWPSLQKLDANITTGAENSFYLSLFIVAVLALFPPFRNLILKFKKLNLILFIVLVGSVVFAAFFKKPAIYTELQLLLSQIYSFILGFALFFYISDLPLRKLNRMPEWAAFSIMFIICWVLQLITGIWGTEVNRAKRWLFHMQMSEFIIPAMIFFFAWVDSNKDKVPEIRRGLYVLGLFFVPVIICVGGCQKNMSTALIYCIIGVLMFSQCEIIQRPPLTQEELGLLMILKRECVSWKNFYNILLKEMQKFRLLANHATLKLNLVLIVLALSVLSFGYFAKGSSDYRGQRITNWIAFDLDPLLKPSEDRYFETYRHGDGAQPVNAKIAIISGGISGKGPGRNLENNKRKLNEASTDYIFSIICSEWGFLWILFGSIVFAVFLIYYRRICSSKYNAENVFLKRLSTGVYVYLSMQILTHIWVNLSLLPVTGIPFPLFSRGGMSLIMTFAMLGIIFNMTKEYKGD